jgi:hypothetical protein
VDGSLSGKKSADAAATEMEGSAMPSRPLLPFLALALSAASRAGAVDVVDGVWVDDHFPASIQIVAPKTDHNVVSVGVDAATASYVVTVNGRTAEVLQKGKGGPILTINYRGGAGGSDQLTASGMLQVQGMLFGGHNLVTAAGGATVYPKLFGDDDTIDATGGHAYYDIWGGARDVLKGNAVALYPNALYHPTAIPGVFTAGGTSILSLYIVSPRAQGNTVATSIDAAAKTLTVTENGVSVTISTVGLLPSYNYFGSADGGDSFSGIASGFYLFGSGNHVAFHDTLALATIWGGGNTITGTRTSGTAYVHGTNTISGMTALD